MERQLNNKYQKLLHHISKTNIFEEKDSLSHTDQLLATRIFLLLMFIASFVLILFTFLNPQTRTITVYSPSQVMFEKLSSQYPSTLSCPCSQTSIDQNEFLSFNPQYHPICYSYFINQTFISSLSDLNMSTYYTVDFRLIGTSHFQILALLCRTAKQAVQNVLQKLTASQIITDQVLSVDAFHAQIRSLIQQLQTTTVVDVKYLSQFLSLTIIQNRIFTALHTNYFNLLIHNKTTNTVGVSTFLTRYQTSNGSCLCLGDNPCLSQAGFYNTTTNLEVLLNIQFINLTLPSRYLLFTLPGIQAGCLPYDSLLQSTLECFHDALCFNQMKLFLDQLVDIAPLEPSHFPPNTTVNDLFDHLLIESWNETSDFDDYFHACAPHSCTYSYDRRFNFLHTLITFISFLGGLRLVLYFLAPLIVKLIKRIQKLKYCRTTNQETMTHEQEQKQSIRDHLLTIVRKLYNRLMTLNLFPTSSTFEDGIYSTRIFLLVLIIAILILVFYTSIAVHIQTVTINHPSIDKFEQLNNHYSSTLICLCTQLSISYSTIIHIQPNYHHVCLSDFVNTDRWFRYFDNLGILFYTSDFRLTGSAFFNLLKTLCEMSNETVTNELFVFNNLQFVSTRALTRDTFHAQTFQLIHQFQEQTLASFVGLFELVRALIQLNQFIVRGYSNARLSLFYHDLTLFLLFTSRNQWSETCSCGTNSSCIRPQAFYCRGMSCNYGDALAKQTIPGLVLSCLQVDSFLLSTLECFYNSSCIRMLIDWRSFDFPSLPGEPRINVTPLDSMMKSRFNPTTILSTIVSQLFIEEWINSTDFTWYYNQCSPKQCIYSFTQRYSTIYVISTVFGLIGGLSACLRIFIPSIIQFIRRVYFYYKRRDQPVIHERISLYHQLATLMTYVRHSTVKMNIYRIVKKRPTIDDEEEQQQQHQQTPVEKEILRNQQIATRVYFLLFIYSLFIILLFTGFNSEIQSITISTPSQAKFEQLQAQYSSTLSCLCSQIAIQYSNILSLTPSSYHQVCSSDFLSFDFISRLWGSDIADSYYFQLDLKLLSSYFRLLSAFCLLSQHEIEQKLQIFHSNRLITIEVLTQNSFESQMDSIRQTFINQAPVMFRQRQQYIIDMFQGNQLHTMFLTNWNFSMTPLQDNFALFTNPVEYNDMNRSCSCATSSTCSRQLVFNLNAQKITLPGLSGGCLPINGLRQSTLECFYSLSCVTKLFLSANISIISSPILNSTAPTRFTPIVSTSVGRLIDELFIEIWHYQSNYSEYYFLCAPSSCRYTYVKKTDVVYMITTFLGLYGGLTIVIKLIAWYGLCIYRKLCQCFAIRRYVIRPINER